MRLVTQGDPMGCGIACVACVLGVSYKNAKSRFRNSENAATRGYFCKEIVEVLNEGGFRYRHAKFKSKYNDKLEKEGTIVFIERSKNFPEGHYLVKTGKGWMNPWINMPNMVPAKAGYQRKLPGKPQWIIFV